MMTSPFKFVLVLVLALVLRSKAFSYQRAMYFMWFAKSYFFSRKIYAAKTKAGNVILAHFCAHRNANTTDAMHLQAPYQFFHLTVSTIGIQICRSFVSVS